MKGSTNKKEFVKSKIQGKRDSRVHQVNKALPPTTTSMETLPTLANLATISKQNRSQYANKIIMDMMQFLPGYITKKQGSRVVQMLIKWADAKIRNAAFQQLKSHWKDMIRGKYSVFVLKQMARSINIPELADNCEVLQGIYEAAVVLDTFVKHTATGDQIEAIKKKFLDMLHSDDQKKSQSIDNIVMKAVEQNYFHLTMSKFIFRHAIHTLVDNERQKVLACLRTNIISLIYDIEGVKLVFQVINYSNTKDRKDILKVIKPEVANIINSGSSTAYMVLLKLLHSIDDTVLLQKTIIKELLPFLPTAYEDKRIFNIIFSVFSNLNHNNNMMHKWEPKIKFTTSKKDHQQRIGQVRNLLIKPVIELMGTKEMAETLRHESMHKLVIGLIVYTCIDNNIPEYKDWVKDILEEFVNDTKKTIEKDEKTFQNTSLVCHLSAHRVLKYLITMNSRVSEEISSLINNAIGRLQSLFLKHLNKVLHTKSSYILIGIMESTSNSEMIMDQVRKSKIDLNGVVGGQIYLKV